MADDSIERDVLVVRDGVLSVMADAPPEMVVVLAGEPNPLFFVRDEKAEEAWIRLTTVGMINLGLPIIGSMLSEMDSVFTEGEQAAVQGAYQALLGIRERLDPPAE